MEKGDTHSMSYVCSYIANLDSYHMLGNDENFEEFKIWSSKYRRSKISAENYESNCYKMFSDQWNDVFDELVATFPDKQGQDDLIKAHQNRVTQPIKKSTAN